MNENRESFRKIRLTFEEKAFYVILIALRDQYKFEYGTDKKVDGVEVNDKCKSLAKKLRKLSIPSLHLWTGSTIRMCVIS